MARIKVFDKNKNEWVYADKSLAHIPVKGTDYWTEEDKAEIKAYVDEAILGGAW